MTEVTEWQIPPSMPRWLAEAPTDRPVVLLLRHSVRGPLPSGDTGYDIPITETGRRLGRDLGRALAGRLKTLHSSPLARCVQTAEVMREGAGGALPIVPDRLLGDPGAYVVDGRRAWRNWESRGHAGVMAHVVSACEPLPGMAHPDAAARFLVQHMLAVASDRPGVHVFVTHDSLVTATAARMLQTPLGPDDWPWYLEGALIWRAHDCLRVCYREFEGRRVGDALCSLDDVDVVEFARREIASTVGPGSGARFFLAGGAFKTLLTGRPPRDLDLWAPSPEDRAALVTTLEQRGARRLAPRPFADAFEIADRVVEVPHAVKPTTLDERLARFDIGISAVGVEHRADGRWSVRVHPLARESVRRRQVLLLKPLVNWKYSLTTLERARRYAKELNFVVPPAEEAEIWRIFEAQPPEMQAGMMERYTRTGSNDFGVAQEARRRLA